MAPSPGDNPPKLCALGKSSSCLKTIVQKYKIWDRKKPRILWKFSDTILTISSGGKLQLSVEKLQLAARSTQFLTTDALCKCATADWAGTGVSTVGSDLISARAFITDHSSVHGTNCQQQQQLSALCLSHDAHRQFPALLATITQWCTQRGDGSGPRPLQSPDKKQAHV